MNFWIFGSSDGEEESCNHEWTKKWTNETIRRSDFDSQTGEFSWVVEEENKMVCEKCNEKRTKSNTKTRFKYEPSSIEVIDDGED